MNSSFLNFGLSELSAEEVAMINGGSLKAVWDMAKNFMKKAGKEIGAIAIAQWIDEHWDAVADGFEQGAEDGAALYITPYQN